MNNFEKNITFVIVSFKSSHIIEKCIQSINSNIKIVVVENSEGGAARAGPWSWCDL